MIEGSGSGSVPLAKNPDPDPGGPETCGSPKHCPEISFLNYCITDKKNKAYSYLKKTP
jgi:hypothetical protein